MSVRSRELAWDGCINVRDLGGIPLEGGGETRTGVLVRSDNVRLLTEEGRRALVEHGVVRVVDLRWPEELALDPRDDLPVDVVHVSLLGELDPDYHDDVDTYMAAGDPAGYWTASYSSMFEQYPQQFRAALAAIDVRYAFSHSICETCARLLAGRKRAHECRAARGRLKIEQRPCLPPALGSA